MTDKMEFTCCVCGEGHKLMASVAHAPGQYFMCNDCIRKQEDETGEVAIFGPHGIEFVSPERAKELIEGSE